jgi:DNA (cytosine-5)-methyltransferase 1
MIQQQSIKRPRQFSNGRNQPNNPQIVSLFCGAGGLDLGFRLERFKIALAIDFEESAINTHKKNFADTTSIAADLTKLGPKGVMRYMREKIPDGSRIGVIGGPPCQGFSRANPSSEANDPRNLLPSLYVKIIRELQKHYEVEFVVFENVLGMKDRKHSKKYSSLITGLKRLGLTVHEKEVCALDYGVPQRRYRVIISAMRSGKGYSAVRPFKRKGKSTVREAIGMLVEPVFFDKKLCPNDIPVHPNHWTMRPKSNRFNQTEKVNRKTRSFRRLMWDKASPTIAFGNREIHLHPEGKRRLSIYEAMLIQGFPSDFVLEGNLSQQVTQISNAVPPPLARSIAAAVKRSLRGK